jgi:nitroreductase
MDVANEALQSILTRRSIRRYAAKPVEEDKIKLILEAAMAAPSARNLQPWEFIVLTKRETLDELVNFSPHVKMLKEAPLAIVVCGRTDNETGSPDWWVIDCSAAVQNALLAAHALGLGAVWLGVHPRRDRQEALENFFRLPANIKPHSMIAIGYPAEQKEPANRYREERVHREVW